MYALTNIHTYVHMFILVCIHIRKFKKYLDTNYKKWKLIKYKLILYNKMFKANKINKNVGLDTFSTYICT